MLVARNRLLMRLLLLISLLALSCIIVAHIIQEGCLKGTGQACGEDEIQVCTPLTHTCRLTWVWTTY